MPTYGYRCEKNGHEFEVVQSMTDPPLERCPQCRSKLRRIFYPVGIVFKGEGFYATDSRKKTSASSTAGTDKPPEKAADSTTDKASDKAADKPADKAATPAAGPSKPAASSKTKDSK